jgi:hypothetical protein
VQDQQVIQVYQEDLEEVVEVNQVSIHLVQVEQEIHHQLVHLKEILVVMLEQ